jgi:hypothetical protein
VNLTKAHIETIRIRLEQSGITISLLKDDLLDHICCAVEDQIDAGLDFDKSFEMALADLAPKGLSDIEEQTFLMLNNKLIPMKKLTYVFGMLGCMLIVIGWLMMFLHWPGSFQVGTLGAAVFVLMFLPMLAVSKFRSVGALPSYERTSIILGFSSGAIAVLGFMFKIMHLPGANILIVVGVFFIAFGFLPSLFFSMYRKSITS